MANSIVPTQTNVPGIELVYLEDRDAAGIHFRGLAKIVDCNAQTISDAAKGVKDEDIVELEIQTAGGLQRVKFVLENGVVQILETIIDSRCKKETRDNAKDLYRRFAKAGFKLYTMLQVAPEVLKTQVDRHVEEMEILRLRKEVLSLEKDLLDKRDWIVRTMPEPIQQKILGYNEIERIEYRDRILHNDDMINDGSTATKTELCRRYGLTTKNGKPDYKALNQFLERLPAEAFETSVRFQENNELRRDWIRKLDQLIKDGNRNLYLGE